MPVTGSELRQVMGRFATGVTVVTLLDAEGRPQGFTVNSLTSVSLAPPLILVCVDREANVLSCFRRGNTFSVNILHESQQVLSTRFASKAQDKFEGVFHRPGKLGAPLLEGCIGHLECRITEDFPGGDHLIFLGQVEVAETAEKDKPLLFYEGKYATL